MKTLKSLQAAALVSLSLAATSAFAGPVAFTNPGFETGNLSGWTVIGGGAVATASTTVTTFDNTVWTVNANGNYMAQLRASGVHHSAVETTLGLASGTLNSLNTNPNGGNITDASAIYQSFTAAAGDTISFAWNYVATDYVPFNDPAFALLVGPSNSLQVLASIHGLGVAVGTSGNTGWLTYNATINTAGNYKLAFVTTNDKDTALDSVLHIDASAGSCNPNCPPLVSVPEPTSMGLITLMLGGLGFSTRRRIKLVA